MMKVKILIAVITIIFIIILGTHCIFLSSLKKVGTFSLAEYESFVKEFSSDRILGKTLTASDASEQAEKLWIEIYGEDIKEKKPYKVDYDETNNIWLVQGTLKKHIFDYRLGGVPYILIQKIDGKVLAVWHDK